jgi:gliding motility-associated-like protein
VRDEDVILTPGMKPIVAEASEISGEFRYLGGSGFNRVSNPFVESEYTIKFPFIAVGAVRDDDAVFVYNAVSPNNDGLNDFMRIDNIESFPENKVTLFNRWGDKVFEMTGYDNVKNVFSGQKNVGGDGEVPAGTYFYTIERYNGLPAVQGFISVQK